MSLLQWLHDFSLCVHAHVHYYVCTCYVHVCVYMYLTESLGQLNTIAEQQAKELASLKVCTHVQVVMSTLHTIACG